MLYSAAASRCFRRRRFHRIYAPDTTADNPSPKPSVKPTAYAINCFRDSPCWLDPAVGVAEAEVEAVLIVGVGGIMGGKDRLGGSV